MKKANSGATQHAVAAFDDPEIHGTSALFTMSDTEHQNDTAQPPELLYHYTNADGLKKILESRVMWATRADLLNDRAEIKHAVDLAEDEIRRRREALDDPWQAWLNERAERGLRARIAAVYVASFSEDGDSLSQWRGYCPGGGYAIGIESAGIRASGAQLRRCEYDERVQRQLIRALLPTPEARESESRMEGKEVSETTREEFAEAFAQLAPTLKNPSFAVEREWRLVTRSRRRGMPDPESSYRVGKRGFVVYTEMPLCIPGANVPVREIVVSPEYDEGQVSIVRAWLKNDLGLDVNVRHSGSTYRG